MNSEVDTVATPRRRNRLWPETLKREIVAASFEPGASVSVVARRYDVNTNQLFAWRKLYRRDGGALVGSSGPMLFPVKVTSEPEAPTAPTPSAADTIEIEVGDKYRIRIGSGVDGKALRRVLDALEGRAVCRSCGEG
jgi:transposase